MARVVRMQSRICGGGPALHSILLSEGLSYARGARYQTTLIGGSLEPGESSMNDFAEARGVQPELLPDMRRAINPVSDAKAVAATVKRLREIRPLIVHTHTAKAGAVGRTAARLVSTPVVVHTFHGHVFEGYFSSRKAKAMIAAERQLAKWTDRILALSDAQKRDLVSKYKIAPEHKIDVVPLGLELDRFAEPNDGQQVRAELGLPKNAPVVVAAGRLVPIKRFDVLLESFAQVLREVPQAVLLLAGDGAPEERAKLEAQAAPMGASVRLLGWRNDLPQLFAAADVLALSSDNEGTPVAVIEALSAGLPVVATRVGGVEDVAGPDVATLVQPGDAAALAAGMIERLKHRSRLHPNQSADVRRRFSHRRLVRDIENLYDELLEAKLRRGLGGRGVNAPC